MTTLTSAIRETTSVIFCSSCFNQQPQLRHVDFSAACDRGYGNDEAVKIAMDDLILCENCVKEAMAALDISDAAIVSQERDGLQRRLDTTEEELRQSRRYCDVMEEALQFHPKGAVKVDHRKLARPRRNGDG